MVRCPAMGMGPERCNPKVCGFTSAFGKSDGFAESYVTVFLYRKRENGIYFYTLLC
jgi:hypothetical protein